MTRLNGFGHILMRFYSKPAFSQSPQSISMIIFTIPLQSSLFLEGRANEHSLLSHIIDARFLGIDSASTKALLHSLQFLFRFLFPFRL